jgi:heme/copper-type cytochrome/quinol oxidase subunit 2
VHAKAGVPVQLYLISEDVYSCSLAFIIPALNFQQMLDPTGIAVIDIPAQPQGTRMPFSCSMGMFTGEIIFDL